MVPDQGNDRRNREPDDSDEFTEFDQDGLIAFMQRCGASGEDAKQVTLAEKQKLDISLQILTSHPFNIAVDGGTRALAGRYQFRLRKAIVTIVRIAASMLSASIGLVGFPVIGVVGAAVAVVIAFDELKDLLTKLSEVELDAYRSVLEMTNHDRGRDGITASELEQWYIRHYEAPPGGLDQILDELREKKVLQTVGVGQNRKYSILK